MKYYAYYRVSTQTQAEKNSTEMQIAEVGKYCEEHGIELSGTFSDEGISGTKEEREGLYDLLGTMEKGDKVIVQNTARLWRDEFVKVFVKRELMKLNADIISIEQNRFTIYEKNPSEFLINGFMELLDEYERMTIAMKLANGRKAKAKAGAKPCGTAPYGYKWDGKDIVIDYNNNLVVMEIYDKCIDYKGNMSAVKRYCDACGYKTSTGKSFSVQSIKNILLNDFYIGITTYADKKTDGVHEPIIDTETFDKVQNLLARA